MGDTNEAVYIVDGYVEEIAREIEKLFGAAIRRHRESGGAVDGALLRTLRGAVREELLERVPAVLAEHLEGQRQLTASGDVRAELAKRWPGLNVRFR